ncbi:MAG: tripartite tricarboxylate transporter substrate binding protein, partial [Burkholderiales bacterium]|nr:tripartite tricarboxylate transporter substrate binding protein [Burkholderiales bacterium]
MPFINAQIQSFMLSLLLGSLSLLSTDLAADSTYPTRPIRLIVQFSPGGNVDTTARTIARQLSEQLGQQVVIDNRPGANGAIGLELLAGASPDGYTLGIGFIGNFAINPHLLAKTRFDPLKDFTAISRAADAPNILAVHPSVPVKSVADLVAHAGKNPGSLAYGSGGVGTVNHLAAELFSRRAGISLLHVPYKGSGQAITDLIGGNIQLMFGGPPSIAPHARAGRLRS